MGKRRFFVPQITFCVFTGDFRRPKGDVPKKRRKAVQQEALAREASH